MSALLPFRCVAPAVAPVFVSCANPVIHIQAVIAPGIHLFPSRTEQLSPGAPMVLHASVGE